MNRKEAIKAQFEYCEKHNAPIFIPGNGICWSCGKDITTKNPESFGKGLITGCPHCKRSYCG